MNDLTQGRPWGACAAFGCPLAGSMGQNAGDGRWYCFCHINRPSSANDAITMMLNSDEYSFIVRTTLETRAVNSDFFSHQDAWKRILVRMKTADREDLLPGDLDKSPAPSKVGKPPLVSLWLRRLENILVDQANKVAEQYMRPRFATTAPVIGPTHAIQHYQERNDDPHA
ncbi:hypothetical protein ACW910_24255 (plasmid) [Burkholderia ambifaria]